MRIVGHNADYVSYYLKCELLLIILVLESRDQLGVTAPFALRNASVPSICILRHLGARLPTVGPGHRRRRIPWAHHRGGPRPRRQPSSCPRRGAHPSPIRKNRPSLGATYWRRRRFLVARLRPWRGPEDVFDERMLCISPSAGNVPLPSIISLPSRIERVLCLDTRSNIIALRYWSSTYSVFPHGERLHPPNVVPTLFGSCPGCQDDGKEPFCSPCSNRVRFQSTPFTFPHALASASTAVTRVIEVIVPVLVNGYLISALSTLFVKNASPANAVVIVRASCREHASSIDRIFASVCGCSMEHIFSRGLTHCFHAAPSVAST